MCTVQAAPLFLRLGFLWCLAGGVIDLWAFPRWAMGAKQRGEGARAGSNKKLSGVHAMSRTLFASRSKSFACRAERARVRRRWKAPKQAGALSAEKARQKPG